LFLPIFENSGKLKRMPRIAHWPVALTIAGSDSGSGAGVQADLKTFAAFGVHGASATVCLTAQNPKRVLAIESCSPNILRRQMQAVFDELPPAAVKTGMLFSVENVRVVAKFLRARMARRKIRLVVDPVMVSTSGAMLLNPMAIKVLKKELLPFAALVTPNLHEAEVLIGKRITSVEDMRAAAREIYARFGCAALVKGGHLRGVREAADVFFDGRTELLLTAPFIRGARTHGTGCTYSAAVTAALALGRDLPEAVGSAKHYITQAIARSYRAANHSVLNHSGGTTWPKSAFRPSQSHPRRS
jgi:hydroxymethylpyrimidine/phosphomethylpyrimidine kinase